MKASLYELFPIVKNLRGVVYFREGTQVGALLKWIRRKFQYRIIGVIESLIAAADDESRKVLTGKPFLALPRAFEAMDELVSAASEAGVPKNAAEALLCASAFVCPLLLLRREAFGDVKHFAIETVESPDLTDSEMKLHLRIIDYAALDAHAASCRVAEEICTKVAELVSARKFSPARGAITRAINREQKLWGEDCRKRFWRLTEKKGARKKPVVVYLHNLLLLRKIIDSEKIASKLGDVLVESREEIASCLGLVPAFVIDAD